MRSALVSLLAVVALSVFTALLAGCPEGGAPAAKPAASSTPAATAAPTGSSSAEPAKGGSGW